MADPRMMHPWRNLAPISWAAIAALAIAAIVIAASARPILDTEIWAAAPSPNQGNGSGSGDADGTGPDDGAADGGSRPDIAPVSDDVLARSKVTVDNRSPFFIPPRPVKPEPPKPPTTTPVRPTPSVYGGPSLAGILGNRVYFDESLGGGSGNKWLDIGVRGTPSMGDAIRIIEFKDPWIARIEWKGGEFDVPLFEPGKWASGADSRMGMPTLNDNNNAPIRMGGTPSTVRTVTDPRARQSAPAATEAGGDTLDLGLPRGGGLFLDDGGESN